MTVDFPHRVVERDGARERLTTLEADALRYLAEAGRTVSREELLQQVWRYADTALTRACDSTIRRIRSKIEVDPSAPEVLLTVHGAGYRLVVGEPANPPPVAPTPPGPPERVAARRHRLGDRVVDLDRVRIERPDGPVPLTANEAAVLEALIGARGVSIDRDTLQRRIWGSSGGRALDNTVARLRRKLEPEPACPRLLLTTAVGYRVALDDDPLGGEPPPSPRPESAVPGPPAEVDRLFGRQTEVDAVLARLDAGDRLITLTGPGGVGKTRLARAVARALLARGTRVLWVDTIEVRDLDALYTAVALPLRARLPGGEPLEGLVRVLRSEGDLVLVLDNVEQVAGISRAAAGLLERADALRILVTSRVLLRTRGERRIVVEPLPVEEAAALFVDRAHRPAEPAEIEALVGELERLPLAIELAAARTRLLSVAEIRRRAGERLELLAADDPHRPERQRSLRAALDGSWELAGPVARGALTQLTVFEGGFGLDAAEQVLDLPDGSWAVDVLQDLVDASLLQVGADGRRFSLLEVVREYARGHLPPEERLAAEGRHGRWFATLAEGGLDGPREIELRALLALELPNLRAALHRALERGEAEVAVGALCAASEVWWHTGPYDRALGEVDRVLGLPGLEGALRARVELLAGRLRAVLGDLVGGERHLYTAMALARDAGDAGLAGEARQGLAMLYHRGSQYDRARAEAEAALALARQAGRWSLEARALAAIAAVDQQRFALDRADESLLVAEQIALDHRALGLWAGIARRLGGTALMRGRVEQGLARFEKARAAAVDVGEWALEAWLLLDVAQVHRHCGRFPRAAALAEAAVARLGRIGDRLGEGMALNALGSDRIQLGDPDGAEAALVAALPALRESGSRLNECLVLNSLGGLTQERGRLEQSCDWFRAGLEIALEIADLGREGLLRSNLGQVLCLRGCADEGLREIDEALGCYERFGDRAGRAGVLLNLADALADLGRLPEAREAALEAREIGGERGTRPVVERALSTLAGLAARAGDPEAGAALLDELGPEPANQTPSRVAAVLVARAEIALARRDVEAARTAVKQASELVPPAALGARFTALQAAVGLRDP